MWKRSWSKFEKLYGHINENLSGIRVVKAFAQEDGEIVKFNRHNHAAMNAGIQADRIEPGFWAAINFAGSIGMLLLWLIGGKHVIREEISLGTLIAFQGYMWMLYGPLEWLSQVNQWMTRAFTSAERIFELMDTVPESYDLENAIPLPEMEGKVEFKDVEFGYDKSKPVLKGVNLTVEPGEMIGLVGKSGAGKTTMINLVCRFFEVDNGLLEIDSIDLKKIRLEDLRGKIGIVLQDSFLFNSSIMENIAYAKPDATFEEIVEAAKIANAHHFILAKTDGYDTIVGERGNELSGGEKQRISIARAILHNPKILILDEATSSVDIETEKQIQEAISRLVKGRTTFAIAHRLSTLRNADRLVVLDEGKIVEVGNHAELMEKKGVFYKLVQTYQDISKAVAYAE
jgi:ATP-binding cassette subfamily B protein